MYMTINSLQPKQFDIETAFLYGKLDKEIYMQVPDGYKNYLQKQKVSINIKNYCLRLNKAIYGLKQAACQWWQEFTKVLPVAAHTVPVCLSIT